VSYCARLELFPVIIPLWGDLFKGASRMPILEPILKLLGITSPWAQLAIVVALLIATWFGGSFVQRIRDRRKFNSFVNLDGVSIQMNFPVKDELRNETMLAFTEIATVPLAEMLHSQYLAEQVQTAVERATDEVNFISLEGNVHRRMIKQIVKAAGRNLHPGEGSFLMAFVCERYEGLEIELKVFLVQETFLRSLMTNKMKVSFYESHHSDRLNTLKAMWDAYQNGDNVIHTVHARPMLQSNSLRERFATA
jgi:hypothetical protein